MPQNLKECLIKNNMTQMKMDLKIFFLHLIAMKLESVFFIKHPLCKVGENW